MAKKKAKKQQVVKEFGLKAKGKRKRGQGSIPGMVALLVSLLVVLGVVYPVVNDAISSLSLTGISAVLGGILTLLLMVSALVSVAYLFGGAD